MVTTEKSPQEQGGCACPAWSSAVECVRIRYGRNPTGTRKCRTDELEYCECVCHDQDDECPHCGSEEGYCACPEGPGLVTGRA